MLAVRKLFNGKRAWLVNTVSGAGLFLIGDAIEQNIEVRQGMIPKFDWSRFCMPFNHV